MLWSKLERKILFEDIKTNQKSLVLCRISKKYWILFLFPYKFINFLLCFHCLSRRVSSQNLYNLFQHSEAIIVPFEKNGFHELIIMDHSELEILYVVSFRASKWPESCASLFHSLCHTFSTEQNYLLGARHCS